MFNYVFISLPFLFVTLFLLFKLYKISPVALFVCLAGCLVTTLVFDNLIIWASIVDYNESLILGVKLFLAPIEDFFYIVFAIAAGCYLFERLNTNE